MKCKYHRPGTECSEMQQAKNFQTGEPMEVCTSQKCPVQTAFINECVDRRRSIEKEFHIELQF